MTYYSALHYAAKAEAAATTATTLLPYLTDITTVATNIASVNTVSTNISDVTTAATNILSINTNATNISNINAVAGDIASVVAVAGDLTNIDNASTYAAEAKQWAIGDPSEPVDGSAKYWAQQAAGQVIPSQTGHSGEYLTTDGSALSWNNVDALPSQIGQAGKYLTTDGTDASWATISIPSVDIDGKSITRNSSNQLQTIGVINQNDTTTALKTWSGTKAQYDAIVTKDANTLYEVEGYGVFIGTTQIATNSIGLRVGDIGQSAFGIDETLNERRYLNGQVISQAQFVQFTAFLKSRVSVYPSLATTEVNWQAAVTNSALGQCGQFVIDDDAGTIRLPKVVNINGLQDLTALGGIKAESLPNIKGDATYQANYNKAPTGPFVNSADTRANTLGAQAYITAYSLEFDASRSSSAYQDDAPVQQEAVQYPYFIQVAEGIENSVDVSREIELNNPFSLLDYKYSEYELSNASWLLSNGQWNSGTIYQSVYNLLLQIYNGTVTKAGVSVKLSTETYADTDFVLNTSDTTFRLPLKVLIAGSKRVAGNGMTLGCTNGSQLYGLYISTNDSIQIGGTDGYGKTLPYANRGSGVSGYNYTGITTDPLKSGIETSANGLYLYFYVGETVQDANVIAAGQALTDIANLKAHYVTETYTNGTSGYRVWSDGYCEQWGKLSATGSYGQADVVLLKEMQLPYVVSSNIDWANVSGWYTGTTAVGQCGVTDIAATPSDKTSTGFKLQKCSEHSWYLCGYMA